MIVNRRRFIGAAAALTTMFTGARNLWSQLIGSNYKFTMESGPGPETIINGKRYLYFGGTGYFGFQSHPDVLQAAQKALAEFGMDTATSRDIFGTSPLLLSVEKNAREFMGTEDAIYLPSGYLVNIAAFQALTALHHFDAIFVDKEAHWSITDFVYALQKPVHSFGHGDANDLERKLKTYMKPGQKPLVASDGIFPTFGKIAPVPAYLPLVEAYDGLLWLDDCHGLGVLGRQGRGTYDHYGLGSERLYSGSTLSKAMGAHGGIIAGKEEFILAIRAGHIVNGANASVSAAAAAAVTGIRLMTAQPNLCQQLWQNASQLKSGLKAMGFDQDNTPVPIAAWVLKTAKEMDQIQAEMMKRGIAIQRTEYVGSGPNGVLRAVVFANHRPEQISHMLSELKSLV
jgi:8-amino-7-oxononanoate synthase